MQHYFLILPFAALLVAAQQGKDDAIVKEKVALRGTWQVVSVADATTKVSDGQIRASSWVFSGDKLTIKLGDKAGDTTYTIDPTKSPKEFDMTIPEVKQLSLGIYNLDGDTLVVCGAGLGKARPTEFKASAELKASVVTLKRVTQEDAIAKEKAALRGKWKVVSVDRAPNDSITWEHFKLTITFSDTQVIFATDKEGAIPNSYKIDPTKTPKEMDTTVLVGADKGDLSRALYKLDGDTLVICVSGRPGNPRPTEFKASKETKWMLMTFKRIKE